MCNNEGENVMGELLGARTQPRGGDGVLVQAGQEQPVVG